MEQEFFDKIIKLIENNIDKVEYYPAHDESPEILSFPIYRPYDPEDDEEQTKAEKIFENPITGFRLNFEFKNDRVHFDVYQLEFIVAPRTGAKWTNVDTPIQMTFVMDITDNYIKALNLRDAVRKYQGELKNTKKLTIMKEFINDELTFESPIESIFKKESVKFKKANEIDNYQQEPSIMNFGGIDGGDEL